MKETIKECPYCFSGHVSLRDEEHGEYYCESCECWFTETDVEVEDLRHEISHILIDTDEDNPMHCDIVVGETDAQGLSSLELPRIDKCYQMNDGTMWFHIEGTPEDDWKDFDYFVVEDMRNILIGLQGTL